MRVIHDHHSVRSKRGLTPLNSLGFPSLPLCEHSERVRFVAIAVALIDLSLGPAPPTPPKRVYGPLRTRYAPPPVVPSVATTCLRGLPVLCVFRDEIRPN